MFAFARTGLTPDLYFQQIPQVCAAAVHHSAMCRATTKVYCSPAKSQARRGIVRTGYRTVTAVVEKAAAIKLQKVIYSRMSAIQISFRSSVFFLVIA